VPFQENVMRITNKEIKNGSIWLPLDGVTKGFVTVTRKEGSTLYYKHTDDMGYIHPATYVVPEEKFLERFKAI
jgi:hypothetical protein